MYEYQETDGIQTCVFTSTVGELAERVSEETSYLSATIRTDEGVPLVDDYAVTEDEYDIITDYIKESARRISSAEFAKLSRRPHDFDGDNVIFRAEAKEEAEGTEDEVDEGIKTLIAMTATFKWLSTKGLDKFLQTYAVRIAEAEQTLHRSMFGFRM